MVSETAVRDHTGARRIFQSSLSLRMDSGADSRGYELKPRQPGEKLKIVEAVVERRDRNMEALHKRAQKVKKLRAERKQLSRPPRLLSATKLVKDNVLRKAEKKRLLITSKKNKRMAVISEDAPILLVVRNDRKVPPKSNAIEKALATLRLTVANNARLVANTPGNRELIRKAEVYLFYGIPAIATVSSLLHKNAFVRPSDCQPACNSSAEKRASVPLADNTLLERLLGETHGIFCVEDVEAVMLSGDSPAFEAINALLTPFHFQDFRKVSSGANIKTSRPLWGFVKRIDRVVRLVA